MQIDNKFCDRQGDKKYIYLSGGNIGLKKILLLIFFPQNYKKFDSSVFSDNKQRQNIAGCLITELGP